MEAKKGPGDRAYFGEKPKVLSNGQFIEDNGVLWAESELLADGIVTLLNAVAVNNDSTRSWWNKS